MKLKNNCSNYLFCLLCFLLIGVESYAQKKLIHYWDMNNTLPAGGSGGLSVSPLPAEYSTLGHAVLVYNNAVTTAASCGCTVRDSLVDNGAGGSTLNEWPVLGNDTGGTAGGNLYIRTRNPMNNMKFLWYMPTTNYINILLKYSSELSSAGKPGQNYSYSLDSGLTFITTGLPMTTYTPGIAWGLQSLDLTSIPGVNNNPKFVFCISYSGAASQATSGNDRYDNITLIGDSICPSYTLQPTSQSVCTGTSTYFLTHVTGGVNNTYQWQVNTGSGFTNVNNGGVYSGATTDSLVLTGVTSGMTTYQYNCIVSSGTCGNITTNNVVLTVSPTPTVTVNSATICVGNTATLTANGAGTYTWTPSTGLSATTGASVTANPTVTTTYNVVGTTGICSSAATATVTVNPIPTITISGSNIICSGHSTTLTANGANTYTWTAGPTTATYSVSPVTNTTYTVTGTDINNCINSTSQSVTVKTSPTIGVNSATICIGNSTTLNATGGLTYTWSPATGLSSINGASVTANPTVTTFYSVIGTSFNGCTNSTTSTVTVNSLPTLSVTGNTVICVGNSTTLTANGASTYTWTSGPSTASYSVSPVTNTVYTVTGTDANNCVNSTTQLINVNSLPTLSVTGNTVICIGNSTTLTANGASTYTWTAGPSTATNTVSPITNTTYTVTGTDVNNCVNSTTQNVTVNSLPTITINPASVCIGNSTTLTANGANTYTWTAGPVSQSYTVSPITNTVYTVTGADANNCVNTATQTVTVNSLPVLSVTGNTVICIGNSTTLTANGANTYTWTAGPSTATNTVSPIANTTYTVTGTDANSCTNSTTQNVTVHQLPTINITGVTSVCIGNSTTLTANGASTYTWTAGPSTSANTVSPITNTTYTVTGTDVNNCVNSTTQLVNVNSLPTLSVTGNTVICIGNSTTLTANGASTYTWTAGPSTSANTVSPITNTTYTVTGTDVNNCVNSTTQLVSVNSLPTITSATAAICIGNSTILTANGANTYTWSPATGLSATTGSSVTANPTVTTTYTITGNNGCVNTTTTSVTVNSLPTLSVTGNTVICVGNSTTLTANGANTYVWTGGPSTAANIVSPIANTTYTVTGTDANSCTNSTTQNVTVHQLPTINITGVTSVCIGNSTTLTANGANTYTWTVGPATAANTVSPIANTIYTVTATDANNCVNAATQLVNVNQLPIINISGAMSVCIGSSITLTANGANTYTWAAGPSTSANTVSPIVNTTYTVTGTDVNNCKNSTTQSITVNSLPTITISGTTTVCGGQPTILTANGANTYVWTGGPNTAANTVSPTANTTYTVTGTDANNCSNTATQSVSVHSLPNVLINQGVSTVTIFTGASVTLIASGATNYQWTSGNVSCNTCASNTESPSGNTQYCVMGTDNNNCVNTSCINVTVEESCGDVFIPDAFSPNGDGANDLFKVYGKCINALTLQVFDRWGNKIFETSDPLTPGWDGTYQGSTMNSGTYIYQATYTLNSGGSGKNKGNFILIR